MKETKEKYPEKATDLSQLSDWRLFYSIWCTVVHLHKLFIQVTPTFNTHLFVYKTIFLLFNIFICYKIVLKFFVLSVYLHGTVTILPTAREITHKKNQCIILESNRECANGLFHRIVLSHGTVTILSSVTDCKGNNSYNAIKLFWITFTLFFRECNKRKDVLSVVNDFYAGIYLQMYQIWKSQGKTISDSGYVIKRKDHL
jgi:hypothetical protein